MASAFRILGEGQLSLTKFLLLLDQPMDLKNFQPVLEHVLARFRPETDLYVLSNLSMDTLDYAGPALNEGSKAVMMGVGPAVRELPRQFRGELPGGVGSVAAYCGGCLVVSGPAYAEEPGAADRLAANFPGWPLVVLVDDAREATRSDSRCRRHAVESAGARDLSKKTSVMTRSTSTMMSGASSSAAPPR